MIHLDLQQLIRTLTPEVREALEAAAQACTVHGGDKIAVQDLLLGFLRNKDSILRAALAEAGAECAALEKLLVSRSQGGVTRSPTFSADLMQWFQDALLVANVEQGRSSVDECALLLAILRNPLCHAGAPYQPIIAMLDPARLLERVAGGSQSGQPSRAACADSALRQYTHDLTQQARDGKLDPVLCRDFAIRQMIDILARRRKNNPIVVGEAGVGKTAVVEGLALRIVAGEVPDALRDVSVLSLDMGLLQAGASLKGEFERRLQAILAEVKASSSQVILFIDEAHTLIGAGGNTGGSDAANLLKPALARGELRTIAATTWSEYRQYIEKDPALARRFQAVQLHEPTVEEAITVLRGLAPLYERTHGVFLRDDAVCAAARLSARYINGRQLPDKAVDLLDTACARVKIGLASAPSQLEQARDYLAQQERYLNALNRDHALGIKQASAALGTATKALETAQAAVLQLESSWREQRELAQAIIDARREQASEALAGLMERWHQAVQDERLLSYEVCPRLVGEVVSQWTGVPLSHVAQEHSQGIETFAEDLSHRVVGQDAAVTALARAAKAGAAGLGRPDGPAGVFLLVGPSGVGKTETAVALADLLFGGQAFLTTINMGEFQEKHSVSRLIGSPPGYVGYGEGGVLTEAVRRKPYSVVLLDEVEKADPDVLNLFYQIFDKGVANDSEGRVIDFRNCLILLTSNLASEQIAQLCTARLAPSAESLEEAIRPALARHFKPALLSRMSVVPYLPMEGAVVRQVVRLKLDRYALRLGKRGLALSYCDAIVEVLAGRCERSDRGARSIDACIEQVIQPQIVDRLLQRIAGGANVARVALRVTEKGGLMCDFA